MGQSQLLCIPQISAKQSEIFNEAVSRKTAYRLGHIIAGVAWHVKGGWGQSQLLCIPQISAKQSEIFNGAVSRKTACRLGYMIARSVTRLTVLSDTDKP